MVSPFFSLFSSGPLVGASPFVGVSPFVGASPLVGGTGAVPLQSSSLGLSETLHLYYGSAKVIIFGGNVMYIMYVPNP